MSLLTVQCSLGGYHYLLISHFGNVSMSNDNGHRSLHKVMVLALDDLFNSVLQMHCVIKPFAGMPVSNTARN